MATLEGTRLPGNFTLCEDLPGEIMASKLSVIHKPSSPADHGASETVIIPAKSDNSSGVTPIEVKANSNKSGNHTPTTLKSETGQLLDPLLARLADTSSSNEKQKQPQPKLKGSMRSRGVPESSSHFFNTMTGIPSTTEMTHGNHSPLSDMSGSSISENSNDMFGYKQTVTLPQLLTSGKHQVLGDDRGNVKLAKHALEQVHGQSTRDDITEQTINHLHRALNSSSQRSPVTRSDAWAFDDPAMSSIDTQESMTNNYNRHSTIWSTSHKSGIPSMPLPSPSDIQFSNPISRNSSMDHGDYFGPSRGGWGNNRRSTSSFQPGPSGPPVTTEPRMYSRRPSFNSGGGSSGFSRSSFDYSIPGHQPSPSTSYTPSPIGTPLSPTATEFTASSGASANVWNTHGHDTSNPQQTYVSTIEPLNYRRLLERSVNCNWKYIVDKIVCNNDQQASIFLQQKLKISTPEQKHAIVDAIVSQAYPLMVNRFGNFLVQRCFEHGTSEQIDGIANAIRGNTLALSMDAFGCHVVQKALDCVNEEFKATMVSELLRRIPETVIHRYACHVWQKLFELRWVDAPPQIMKYVNEALRGRWSEVALGETGSLVVQNIFENCLEEDKRPCINEVLANIDLIAHGQFGNWCIQHICEHGAPADRSRAIDVVIHNAPEYSMDQYASKVVEKCLKIGGAEFLERYLDRVCEGRADRPRIPLIDIASDQYGNYLVQWILQHSSPAHREQVASHIRKHMVSLRGSKFGSRVGMLCCNPIYTRPTATSPHTGAPSSTSRYNRYGFR